MKIKENVKPAFCVQFEDSLLSGGDFGIVRLVIPVAIVITRDGVLAACPHRNIIHIHDRHVIDGGRATQFHCGWVIARQPLDKSSAYPTGTGLPGMLSCLDPDAISVGIRFGSAANTEPTHWPTSASLCQFKDRAVG